MSAPHTDSSDALPDDSGGDRGIRCPTCHCPHCPVYYTRPAPLNKIRRSRECRACGRRFITTEERM